MKTKPKRRRYWCNSDAIQWLNERARNTPANAARATLAQLRTVIHG